MSKLGAKSKAGGFHFLISLIIFSGLFITIIEYWFPTPYFKAAGGMQGITIVAAIDLVLGPLLTFIVFNTSKTKRELFQDLGVIITLQLAALIWGIHTIYYQRPIAIVFWENSFFTVSYRELIEQNPESDWIATLEDKPRQLIYAQKPTPDQTDLFTNYLSRVDSNVPPHHQAELYQPFLDNFPKTLFFNIDIEEIIRVNKEMKRQLALILEKTEGNRSQFVYLPLKSRYRNIVLIFDQTGNNIGYLEAPYF